MGSLYENTSAEPALPVAGDNVRPDGQVLDDPVTLSGFCSDHAWSDEEKARAGRNTAAVMMVRSGLIHLFVHSFRMGVLVTVAQHLDQNAVLV